MDLDPGYPEHDPPLQSIAGHHTNSPTHSHQVMIKHRQFTSFLEGGNRATVETQSDTRRPYEKDRQ